MSVRDLVDQSAPARRPAVKAGHVGLGPGLVDEDEPRRIDELLILAPSDPVALYVRTVLLAGDERLFLGVKPMRRRNRLINEVSALTLSQQPVAQRLKGDVGFLGVTGFEELSMTLELQTLVAAHLSRGPQTCSLETLDPFDRNRFADPKARRSAPTAHTALYDRINHTVAQILRVRSGHSCWLHPASRLNHNTPDSRIPPIQPNLRAL